MAHGSDTRKLAGDHVGQVGVPVLVGVLLQRDSVRFFLRFCSIEQAEFDLGGVFSVDGEIDPRAVPGPHQRIRMSRPNSHWVYPDKDKDCFAFDELIESREASRIDRQCLGAARLRGSHHGNDRHAAGPNTRHSKGEISLMCENCSRLPL